MLLDKLLIYVKRLIIINYPKLWLVFKLAVVQHKKRSQTYSIMSTEFLRAREPKILHPE